jgi:hypothetical protein
MSSSDLTAKELAITAVFAAAVGTTVLVLALLSASDSRSNGQVPFFYQSYYEPAVRMACGQSFGVDSSGELSEEMLRFLQNKQQTLSCEHVVPSDNLEPNPHSRVWYHLFATTAQYWKITGISWSAIDGLAAGLLALGAVALYLMLQLWTPALLAASITVLSVLPAMPYLLFLRDLNKTPFILGSLLVAAWLVSRCPTKPLLFSAMAGIGAWIGIGYGFRPDALIGLPLLAVAATFFRGGKLRHESLIGAAASLLMFGAFVAAASPIFSAFNANVGTCHWHFALLGLADAHGSALRMAPVDYTILTHYDDFLVARTVESYATRVLSMPPTGYCTPAYGTASMAVYLQSISTFSGDFLSRALLVARGVASFALTDNDSTVQNISILAWVLVLVGLMTKNLRLGLFALFALVYLCAYPIVQFDTRHYFHLAFLNWLPAGLIISALGAWLIRGNASAILMRLRGDTVIPLELPKPRALLLALTVFTCLVLVATAIIQAAKIHQQWQTKKLFRAYLSAPTQQAIRFDAHSEPNRVTWSLPEPKPSHSSTPSAGLVPVNGRMLRIELGGEMCTDGKKILTLAIAGPTPDNRIQRNYDVEKSPNQQFAIIFAPQYFSVSRLGSLDHVELSLAREDRGCLVDAHWVDSDALPSLWVGTTLFSSDPAYSFSQALMNK